MKRVSVQKRDIVIFKIVKVYEENDVKVFHAKKITVDSKKDMKIENFLSIVANLEKKIAIYVDFVENTFLGEPVNVILEKANSVNV